ncbi:unnamed protein product, partial [Mesocestoides corti]
MRVLAGLPVNGKRFAPNKAWCAWAEAHGCLPVDEEEDDDENGEVQAVCVDVGQESDDEDNVSDVHASAFKDDDNGEFDGGAAVFDENVLSFANMRFHVASETESQVSPPFEREYTDGYFETQRILIWPPAGSPNANIPSVFYFCELLGDDFYRMEFHDLYNTLFTGNVLHSMQSHSESKQTSCLCPWYNFYHHEHYSYQSRTTSVSDLGLFFSEKMLTRPILTDDFCPWSNVDGGGIWSILGGLFCERRRRNWTDSTSAENSVSGHDMAFLFNASFDVEDCDTRKECTVDEKGDEAEEEKEAEDEEEEEEVRDEEETVEEMAENNAVETLKRVDANEVEVNQDVEKSESSGEANSTLEDYRTSDVDGADE